MELIYLKKFEREKANVLEKAIFNRCSTRSFSGKQVKIDMLSKILWAGQGMTDDSGKRSVPSAGAIYPLELFVVAKNVKGLENGKYHYLPADHALDLIEHGCFSESLAGACLHQGFMADAAFSVIVAGDFARTTKKYGARGERYVFMEAGHACQNMSLVAANHLLGTVVVGAFLDRDILNLLNLGDWFPIAVMPFGHEL